MENRPRPQVIDLVSSDDDDFDDRPVVRIGQPLPQDYRGGFAFATPPMEQQAAAGAGHDEFAALDNAIPGGFPELDLGDMPDINPPAPVQDEDADGEYVMVDGEAIFIPNSPPRRAPSVPQMPSSDPDMVAHASPPAADEIFTVDTCLQRVLAIFPDVSHEHVHKLYNEFDSMDGYEAFSGRARFESIIDKLASADSYPKQLRGNRAQKRKREDEEEDDAKRWTGPNREPLPLAAKGSVSAILKADFPEMPKTVIAKLVQDHKHLYQAYVAVANEKDTSQREWRGRPSLTNLATADIIADGSGIESLGEELRAARKRVQSIRAQRASDEAQKRVEEENLQRAIAAGETAECQACFEDLPMNRQIHCNGDEAHFTCFDCATTYIKTEVGDSRCRVLCTAGCGAGFAHAQLHLLTDKKLLEKLEQLQQEKDIRDAGLDDLEECPFCDYKAIMPPIEENFEFRCANPECEKVSCRRCKAISHIPMSCEEHAKDNKLNTRHKIEEAMTAALVRHCNKCKKQFIKEFGCNKMSCPSCGNMQCYVCSESLKDYNHFDQGAAPGRTVAGTRTGKCPLYDNVEERHDREVKEAEVAARAKAMEENPDVTEKDLEIKESDAVKKANADRVRRAGAVPGAGFPAGLGGLLAMDAAMHRFGDLGADEDEDGDHEEDMRDPFRDFAPDLGARRRRAPIRPRNMQAIMRDNLAALRGLGALGANPGERRNPRDPRIQHPQAAPAPVLPGVLQAPQNPAALGQVAGVIPVYGVQPAVPNFPAPPVIPPAPQPGMGQAPGRHQQGVPAYWNGYEDPFFANAEQFDFNRFMGDPPAQNGVPYPRDPRPPLPAANANVAPRPAAQQNDLTARFQLQRAQQAQLRQAVQIDAAQLRAARAERLQAIQNLRRNMDRRAELRNMNAAADPRRYNQGQGYPGAPQSG